MRWFEFSYAVTKPYPYWWFKWVVLVGGVLITVLFSLLNLAANGYILTLEYTTHVNETLARKTWAEKFSFPAPGRVSASCQPQSLQVNSEFFTDKLSLVYRISNVWHERGEGSVTVLPSLQYTGNTLENCNIELIQVHMFNYDGRTAAEIGWLGWSVPITARIRCAVQNRNGPTFMNLTTTYNLVTERIAEGVGFQFVQPANQETRTSLWSWYWLSLARRMENQNSMTDGENRITTPKGSVSQSHTTSQHAQPLTPPESGGDIQDLDFFNVFSFHFVGQALSGTDNVLLNDPTCCINPSGRNRSLGALHHEQVFPDVWIEVDTLAKVFYSMILTDLGRVNASTNILQTPSLLAAFSANITNMNRFESPWLKAGPARQAFDENSAQSASLDVTPSTVYAEYLCQVPTLKSAGSLIISIVIANLVFLQATWIILNWATTKSLEGDSTAYYCEGCMHHSGFEGTELQAVKNSTVEYSSVPSESIDDRR